MDEKSKGKMETSDKEAILLLAIVGIQIIYAGYMILKILITVLGFEVNLLGNRVILFNIGIYAIVLYVGISFFREKTYGWYGEAGLYIILFSKNILFFISIITGLLFKESLLKDIYSKNLCSRTYLCRQ